jgi:hypothetical protein
VNLDRVYYDRNSQMSRKKILLDYLNASTINESYRLKKKRVKYEEKIKDVIKVEQLQTQLANRIIEEESIKQQVKKLQLEKESEALSIAAKYEKDIRDMREQMSRIMSKLSIGIYQARSINTEKGRKSRIRKYFLISVRHVMDLFY